MSTQSAPTEEEEETMKALKALEETMKELKILEKTKRIAEEYDNLFNKLEAGQGLTTEEVAKLVEDFEYLGKVPPWYEEAHRLARKHIFSSEPYVCTVDYFGVDPVFKYSVLGVSCYDRDTLSEYKDRKTRAYVFTNAKSPTDVKGVILFNESMAYRVNREPLVLYGEDAVRAMEALATVFNLGLGGLLSEPLILDHMEKKGVEPLTNYRYVCTSYWSHYGHGSTELIRCYDYNEFPEKLEPTGPPWYIIASPKRVYVAVKDEYQDNYKVKEINDEKAVNFIRSLLNVNH